MERFVPQGRDRQKGGWHAFVLKSGSASFHFHMHYHLACALHFVLRILLRLDFFVCALHNFLRFCVRKNTDAVFVSYDNIPIVYNNPGAAD